MVLWLLIKLSYSLGGSHTKNGVKDVWKSAIGGVGPKPYGKSLHFFKIFFVTYKPMFMVLLISAFHSPLAE